MIEHTEEFLSQCKRLPARTTKIDGSCTQILIMKDDLTGVYISKGSSKDIVDEARMTVQKHIII